MSWPLSRRLTLITLVLVAAAALRILGLTRIPPGLSDAEITNIYLAESVRGGAVALFYGVGDPAGGHEGLYPILQSLATGMVGDGLLPYRALSVWCGMISVALMYSLARRLFGEFAGLIAACALAVTTWPILISRMAIREALLLPLVIGTLLVIASALHIRERIRPLPPASGAYAGLGALLALACYTQWSGLALVILFLAFVIYLIATRQPISRRVRSFTLFSLLVALIVGIPYIVIALRGSGMSGLHYLWNQRPDDVFAFVRSALQSISSVVIMGDVRPDHNLPGNPLIGPPGAVLLIVGIIGAARRWRSPNMMLMLLTLGLGVAVDAWTRAEPNFVHGVIAIPATMALIGLGASITLRTLIRIGVGRAPLYGAAFALVVLSIVLAANLLFVDWARRQEVNAAFNGRLGNLAAYLDRTADGLTTSICTFNLESRAPTELARFGLRSLVSDSVLLDWMMHREDVPLRFSNCLTGLVLTGGGARQRFAYADPQARVQVSPLLRGWLANAEPVHVDGLIDGSVVVVEGAQAVADSFGQAIRSRVDWAPETAGPSDRAALPLRMGGYLTFEGYQYVPPGPYHVGDRLTIVTYWRADGQQVPGLRLFAHVMRNPYTEPVLQNDILSVDARYLADRDVFMQVIEVPIPADLLPGEYLVSVGAYSAETNARLPIYDENQERGNRLFLDRIVVN